MDHTPKSNYCFALQGKDYLTLDMKDCKGNEYLDGDIVQPAGKQMLGIVRYFAGRFEIVCQFSDQRFIFGLNPDHEIKGHITKPEMVSALARQMSQTYATHCQETKP